MVYKFHGVDFINICSRWRSFFWQTANKLGKSDVILGRNLIKALHSELLTEVSSRFLSRNEFSQVETGQVERHFFVIFGNFGKRLLPKLAKTKSSEKAKKLVPTRKKFGNFESERVFGLNFAIFVVKNAQIGPKMAIFCAKFPNFFAKILQVFLQFLRVWKARTLPKYFRNSKKVNFRNSRKRKFWKKPSFAGP